MTLLSTSTATIHCSHHSAAGRRFLECRCECMEMVCFLFDLLVISICHVNQTVLSLSKWIVSLMVLLLHASAVPEVPGTYNNCVHIQQLTCMIVDVQTPQEKFWSPYFCPSSLITSQPLARLLPFPSLVLCQTYQSRPIDSLNGSRGSHIQPADTQTPYRLVRGEYQLCVAA